MSEDNSKVSVPATYINLRIDHLTVSRPVEPGTVFAQSDYPQYVHIHCVPGPVLGTELQFAANATTLASSAT